jgi:hypothetical protein
MGKLFPKYTWVEWSLLGMMVAALIIIPSLLPDSLAAGRFAAAFKPGALGSAPATMRFTAVFVLVIALGGTAFLWQDPSFMREGYAGWLGLLVFGPALAIVTYYMHGLHALIVTGVGCAYSALWSILRVFLRRKFLHTEMRRQV